MSGLYNIEVGDLILRYSPLDGRRVLGYVIRITKTQYGDRIWCNFSNRDLDYEGWIPVEGINGHWKVINFEEENKMTTKTKTLNETETLNFLLNGKELQKVGTDTVYRMKNNRLEHKNASTRGKYINSKLPLNDLLSKDFVEYKETFKEKFKVGDWVRVTLNDKRVWLIQVAELHEESLYGTIYEELTGRLVDPNGRLNDLPNRTFELMTPEQVKEYKIGQVFKTVGRDPFTLPITDMIDILKEKGYIDTTFVWHRNFDGWGDSTKSKSFNVVEFGGDEYDYGTHFPAKTKGW